MKQILRKAYRFVYSYFTGSSIAWREAVIRSYGAEW